jgi:hypothetical protein
MAVAVEVVMQFLAVVHQVEAEVEMVQQVQMVSVEQMDKAQFMEA